ncbi:aromatic ring-hydroxylating dioxygenase subunit alpha, partial [Klebsiella pneumoniae]
DCTEIPFLGDWDSEGMKVVVADSYVWETTAERRWENFTDFSHFAFVHPGTLYDPFFATHPTVNVDRISGEMRFQLAPPKEMYENLPEEAPMGDFIYRCSMPYSVNLEIKLWKDDSKFILWTTSSPVDDTTCRNFMVIVRTEDHQPDHIHLAFQKRVLEEDRPIIQSQSPMDLDSSELCVSTDKISIQYRKWHRELSMAALEGKEAFKSVLLSEVTESR